MKEILPVIMNTNFERLAVIDDYNSFIWAARYYACGDFELCVDVNDKNMHLFMKDYYVVRDDDDNVGIIEDIKIQRNADDRELLIVTGRFLAGILARRIIGEQTVVTGTIGACISTLIVFNVTNPSIAARKISNFVLGSNLVNITSTRMQAQYTGQNLLETISEICETYGLGYKVTLNDQNQFVFQLYQGTDHTYDQAVNPFVIFSDKYDNLLSSEYEENYRDYSTAALVAGEGEGLARKTLWVTDGQTGLDRREIYVDQRNIQSDDGEISDAEYNQLLQEAGEENLTKYTVAFQGTVFFENVKYKEDVNLGDLVVIENSRWGIYMNSRLVEVIESIDETGKYSIVPSFGL